MYTSKADKKIKWLAGVLVLLYLLIVLMGLKEVSAGGIVNQRAVNDPYRSLKDRAAISCHQDVEFYRELLICGSPVGPQVFYFNQVRVSEEGYQYWNSGLHTYLFCDVEIDEYKSPPNNWNCWNVVKRPNLAL